MGQQKIQKILIVDDDPAIVMSLEFLLRKANYNVFIALSGLEAIEIIKEQIPELILLDIMMPDVNGYEVCDFIKKDEKYKNAKVIFLSAKSRDEDIKLAYKKGADLFIIKPFSTRRLMEKITTLLNK